MSAAPARIRIVSMSSAIRSQTSPCLRTPRRCSISIRPPSRSRRRERSATSAETRSMDRDSARWISRCSRRSRSRSESQTEFRVEIFNLFNRTNWANPNVTFSSSSFGQLTRHSERRFRARPWLRRASQHAGGAEDPLVTACGYSSRHTSIQFVLADRDVKVGGLDWRGGQDKSMR